MSPRRPQERPKRRQDGPRRRQQRPKSRPRGEKKEQIRSPSSVVLLGWPPGGLREPFWLDFGGPGEHFGAIFEDFRSKLGRKARRAAGSKRAKRSQRQTPGAGRAAAEQGHTAIHSACNLHTRVALATPALLLLVAPCSRFSCRSCFSPRVLRRLQCLRLSR